MILASFALAAASVPAATHNACRAPVAAPSGVDSAALGHTHFPSWRDQDWFWYFIGLRGGQRDIDVA